MSGPSYDGSRRGYLLGVQSVARVVVVLLNRGLKAVLKRESLQSTSVPTNCMYDFPYSEVTDASVVLSCTFQ